MTLAIGLAVVIALATYVQSMLAALTNLVVRRRYGGGWWHLVELVLILSIAVPVVYAKLNAMDTRVAFGILGRQGYDALPDREQDLCLEASFRVDLDWLSVQIDNVTRVRCALDDADHGDFIAFGHAAAGLAADRKQDFTGRGL